MKVARKDSRGFTLMEMVVVLAVIAILAAVLTPILTSYVERARVNAAMSDLKNIAAAILQFNTDTKIWPIYQTPADIPNGNVFPVEWSPGIQASVSMAVPEWQAALTGGTSLDTMLNTNQLQLATTGNRAWKGAYLNLGADPWGSSYYVTSGNLEPNNTNAAYVLSAGPNQMIETPLNNSRSGTLIPIGDDLLVRFK